MWHSLWDAMLCWSHQQQLLICLQQQSLAHQHHVMCTKQHPVEKQPLKSGWCGCCSADSWVWCSDEKEDFPSASEAVSALPRAGSGASRARSVLRSCPFTHSITHLFVSPAIHPFIPSSSSDPSIHSFICSFCLFFQSFIIVSQNALNQAATERS